MTHQDVNGFRYADGDWPTTDDFSRTVRIPAGITSKKQLLAVLALQLSFPNYFGWNWDAFEECLGDLSWIPIPARIVIVHDDLPLANDVCEAATYLSILRDAMNLSEKSQSPELTVVFPSQFREMVETAIEN